MIDMTPKIFVDTSAWIAYSFKGEKAHDTVVRIINNLIQDGYVICTSNDVIGESVARLVYDTNISIVKQFLKFIQNSTNDGYLVQFWADETVQKEAFDAVVKFYDHKLSYVDAVSYVLIKRFNIEKIITLDSDFKKIGIPSVP